MFGLRPEIKDMAVFFFVTFSVANLNIWGVYLPYYHSYAKHFNPDLTVNDVFACAICLYLGIMICSWTFPTLLAILGLKKTLLLGGLIYSLNTIAMHTFTSFPMIIINVTLIGFCYRYVTTINVLYFTEKYPEKASRYYGIANTGMIVTGLFWANFYTYYVNPENQVPTELYVNGDYHEYYFSYDIAVRFKGVFNIHAITNFLLVVVISFLFEEPEKYKGNFIEFMAWFRGQDNKLGESIRETDMSISLSQSMNVINTYKDSNLNISMDSMASYSAYSEILMAGDDKEVEDGADSLGERVSREFRSPKLWLLLYASIFRMSLCCYFIDSTKLFGLILIGDDKLVTQVYSLSSFVAMAGSALTAFIVERFSLSNAYLGILAVSVFLDFCGMFVIKEYPYLFLLVIPTVRTMFNINMQLSNITLYSEYSSDVALQLNKIFDSHVLIANVLLVFLNSTFYIPGYFFTVFLVYIIFDGLLLLCLSYGLNQY